MEQIHVAVSLKGCPQGRGALDPAGNGSRELWRCHGDGDIDISAMAC